MCALYRKYEVTFIKYSIILYMEFFNLWDFSTCGIVLSTQKCFRFLKHFILRVLNSERLEGTLKISAGEPCKGHLSFLLYPSPKNTNTTHMSTCRSHLL